MDRKWKKRILCITLFFGLAITGCGSGATEEKENSQVLSEGSSSGDVLVNGKAEDSKEEDTTEAVQINGRGQLARHMESILSW